jgi:hypothetical protein
MVSRGRLESELNWGGKSCVRSYVQETWQLKLELKYSCNTRLSLKRRQIKCESVSDASKKTGDCNEKGSESGLNRCSTGEKSTCVCVCVCVSVWCVEHRHEKEIGMDMFCE